MTTQKELLNKIATYKNRIAVTQGNIDRALELLEKLKLSKFKVGDFIFHQKFGNAMVMDLKLYKSGVAYDIQHTGGRETVEESEILPYNDTTKTLYGKV
jgi:hypothetical protein